MTPKAKLLLGLLGGVVMGMLVGGSIAGVAAYAMVRKTESDVHKNVFLVPVMVAARDLPAGVELTFDDVAQRSIPEAIITASIVKPEFASVVWHQRLHAPLLNGDPLRWGFLEGTQVEPRDLDLKAACEAAVEASPLAAKSDRTNADIRARLVKGGGP